MKRHHRLVEIEGYLVHETGERPGEGAYKVRVDDEKTVWLPKMAVEATKHSNGKPDFYVFDVPEDLALEKGLI